MYYWHLKSGNNLDSKYSFKIDRHGTFAQQHWSNNEFITFFHESWIYEFFHLFLIKSLQSHFFCCYSLFIFKSHKSIFKKFINEKFRKWFHFCTCILPDYVPHESSKEFVKNSNFENMRAGFLGRCQKSLWQTSPEMMHFQAWKKIF